MTASTVRKAAVALVMVLSVIVVVVAQRGPSPALAWRMFPESSTWTAEVWRVTDDGRVPVDDPWPGGYRWDDLVAGSGVTAPASDHGASYGVAATLHRMRGVLAWVAANTPGDDETLWLEAVVVTRRNADPPETTVVISPRRRPAP